MTGDKSKAPDATGEVREILSRRPHSIYNQNHLDNWTDADFSMHSRTTRKTVTWLVELEAAIAALASPPPAPGDGTVRCLVCGSRASVIEECAKVADHYAIITTQTTTQEMDEHARKRAAIVAEAIRALAALPDQRP